MKPNIADIVVDKLHERRRMLQFKLADKYKSTKPFRMEPISNEEMLLQYNMLTPEKMATLIDNYGRDAVNELVFTMEKMKQKKMGGR